MATATKDKVEINVIGLGGSQKMEVPKRVSLGELRQATGLGEGTLRINGQNSTKEKDHIELQKGDMVSKEMPKVSHG